MRIWKIIYAILSIILGAFLFYESSQVHTSGQIVQKSLGIEINEFSLYVGFIVSIIYIVIGVCAVTKYKERDKRMNLILLVLAIVAFILSFMGPKIFEDLYVLSVWAIVCIVTIVISIVKNDKSSHMSKRTIMLSSVCPYCNAQIENGSKFCGECGKPIPQGNVCAHCGSTVNEGDIFCEECGRNLKDGTYASADYEENSSIDYMKILLSGLIGVVIGMATLALVGGSWYGYNAYSEYCAAIQAREKFVADSLEQVRKDSIRLAEQKEKERLDSIENARIMALQKPYLDLLDKYGAKDEHWGEFYFLYDLNGDDFPELWLQVSKDDEFRLLVYSNIDGKATLLFSKDVGHPYHHSYHIGKNFVLMNFANMGSQIISKLYVNKKGVVKEEESFRLEAESLEEADYKEVSEPEVSTYDITDKSPIYEIK